MTKNMNNKKTTLVPTKTEDYLDQDPAIRGQRYCCLSFISPEEVIKNKEVYFVEKFLKSYSTEMNELFTNMIEMFKEKSEITDGLRGIQERYPYVFDTSKVNEEYNFYKAFNSDKLENDYLEHNNFQTTIRGLKVRGSYESLKEAQIRAQVLKRIDDNFNVFVAEVGCWCPWSPNPEELENQEYAETHLNTLVKQYVENQKEKDVFFLERKEKLKSLALEDNEKNNKKYNTPKVSIVTDIPEDPKEDTPPVSNEDTPLDLNEDTRDKTVEKMVGEIIDKIVKQANTEDNANTETPIDITTLDKKPDEIIELDEVKDRLNADDPWMQRLKENLNVSANNNKDVPITDAE
jgi:hypothetical protein